MAIIKRSPFIPPIGGDGHDNAISREQVDIAKAGVEAVEVDLEQYEAQLQSLRDAMEQAGLIWVE